MIDPQWESRHGHAVAAIRYGAMSRPRPSNEPDPEDDSPPHLRPAYQTVEEDAMDMRADTLARVEARRDTGGGHYVNV